MNDGQLCAAGAFCRISHRFGLRFHGGALFVLEGLKRFTNPDRGEIEAYPLAFEWKLLVVDLLRKF